MLLKRKPLDRDVAIRWGQIFFLIGILCSRMSKGEFLADTLRNLFVSESHFTAFQGFAAGLSVPLLGLSIYLLLRGIRSSRIR